MASVERHLFDTPPEVIEKILSYCTYDEIAKLRLVCKEFDRLCQAALNKGFIAVDRYHGQCLRNVKGQLPRRESERRNHPLARHCDILTAIETRLSLLGMTFMKYVDMNLCCFIPGKVIDEIYRVLRYIQCTKTPPRAHEILQELRDISSMAMEHFDERIVPTLKQKMATTPARITLTPQGTFSLPGPSTMFNSQPRQLPIPRGIRQDLLKLQQTVKQTTTIINNLKEELTDSKNKILEQQKKIQEQEKRILEQNRIMSEQNAKISEQEGKQNEITRKLLEYDQKLSHLMTEFNKNRKEGHEVPSVIQDMNESASSSSKPTISVANSSAIRWIKSEPSPHQVETAYPVIKAKACSSASACSMVSSSSLPVSTVTSSIENTAASAAENVSSQTLPDLESENQPSSSADNFERNSRNRKRKVNDAVIELNTSAQVEEISYSDDTSKKPKLN